MNEFETQPHIIKNLNGIDTENLPTQIIVYPKSLLNRKQLRSSQTWVDPEKLSAALKGEGNYRFPSVDLVIKDGKVVSLIVTDGHHRTGVAIHNKSPIAFQIIKVHQGSAPYRTWGFNKVYNKIRSQISQL